jgi:serine/threonine protein kinase
MSLFDAKEASVFGLFQPKFAQSIIAQFIHGVALFHSENIVHRGTSYNAMQAFGLHG